MKAWALSEACLRAVIWSLRRGGIDAGALGLLPFGLVELGAREFGLLVAVALGVLARHGLMPEFQLQRLLARSWAR